MANHTPNSDCRFRGVVHRIAINLLKKGTGSERQVKFAKDIGPSRGACPRFQQTVSGVGSGNDGPRNTLRASGGGSLAS